MTDRKQRRNVNNNHKEVKHVKGAGKKLVFMLVSVAFMVFCVCQVYYLAKYTLGHEISEDKMAVYTWVKKLTSTDMTSQDVEN